MSISRMGCLALISMLIGSPVAGQEATAQDFLKCDAIADGSDRLRCYDELSRQRRAATPEQPAQEPATSTPPDVATEAGPKSSNDPAPKKEVAPVPDDLGLSSLARDDDKAKESFRSKVVACRNGAKGKVFFFLDNGQVWQQSDERRVTFEDCSFAVTITKDLFGYKMQPDSNVRAVRISRVK